MTALAAIIGAVTVGAGGFLGIRRVSFAREEPASRAVHDELPGGFIDHPDNRDVVRVLAAIRERLHEKAKPPGDRDRRGFPDRVELNPRPECSALQSKAAHLIAARRSEKG